MNKGDIVYIKYTGKVKETGEIFDLTDEDLAKKEGIYNPNTKYGDVPIILGAGFLLPALEEELMKMKVGEKRTIELPPEKAFGKRKDELIRLIPLKEFEKQKIEATPGSYITVNGIRGRILSVSGGRVRVDFNHPLAGKALIYEIEITKFVTETKEKILAVVKYFTGASDDQVSINLDDKTAEIEVKNIEISRRIKNTIASMIFKWIEGIEKIRFVESFEKQEFKTDQ